MVNNPKNQSELVIATRNQGKIAEIGGLLRGLPVSLSGLDRFDPIDEVEETGSTFAENARLKACGYARQTGQISLADDSGLEVAALDGRPGVLSARYGGEGTAFAQKLEMLLDELRNSGDPDRRARFVCALAIAKPDGTLLFETTGACEGTIAPEARGAGGFGYDPVFIPDGYDSTFGELACDAKQTISHRARAFSQIVPFLRGFFEIST